MGLLSQLGKDFVRSAVKQVGRDGGKIISNQIYGDAHSTPVRNVDSDQPISDVEFKYMKTDKVLDLEGREKAEAAGYSRKNLHHYGAGCCTVFFIFAMLFGSVAAAGGMKGVAYFFGLILVIRAVVKFFKSKVILSKTYTEGSFVQDRRYKSGSRYAGLQSFEHQLNAKIRPSELKECRIYALVYLIAALSFFKVDFVLNSVLRPIKHQLVQFSDYIDEENKKRDERSSAESDTIQMVVPDQESTNL